MHSLPTRTVSRRIAAVWWMVCSVCERMAKSKLLVFEEAQAVFQILLDHVHAVFRGGEHTGIVDLDAVTRHFEFLGQRRKQRAVAAAQIEHRRARFDPAGDGAEVGAQRKIIESALVHAFTSVAIRS